MEIIKIEMVQTVIQDYVLVIDDSMNEGRKKKTIYIRRT